MITRHIGRDLALAVMGAVLLSALLVSTTSIRPAAAQQPGWPTVPPPALQRACAEDVRALCPGIVPGGGRIKQCFIAKREQLSAGCKSALLEARDAMTAK